MTRILSAAALALAVVALAACGSSGKTSGVAGAHHTMAGGRFHATVDGFTASLRSSVAAFQSGNLAKAAAGSSLLARCPSRVRALSMEARTADETRAVMHLRLACSDMAKAAHAGMSGNLAGAKQFARQAATEAQTAAQLSG